MTPQAPDRDAARRYRRRRRPARLYSPTFGDIEKVCGASTFGDARASLCCDTHVVDTGVEAYVSLFLRPTREVYRRKAI
jgi:hypothetical protein